MHTCIALWRLQCWLPPLWLSLQQSCKTGSRHHSFRTLFDLHCCIVIVRCCRRCQRRCRFGWLPRICSAAGITLIVAGTAVSLSVVVSVAGLMLWQYYGHYIRFSEAIIPLQLVLSIQAEEL